MSTADPIDADYQETGTALATRSTAPVAPWVPTFAVAVDEAVERVEAKRDFFRRVMREGEHYGKIPGTGDKGKPALLKPGAELLLSSMGLRIELTDADAPTVNYGEDGREGLIRYRRVCRVYRQTGPQVTDREIVAQAEGSCSSRETKYRWRNDQRRCPECGKPAIIAGKKEYGGGFICFKKKDGCGAKFRDDDPAIIGQAVGKIANPDLADVENTVLKMADKRAVVAAALLATGCSDIFTQDVEENESAGDPPESQERGAAGRQSDDGQRPDPDAPGGASEASRAAIARGLARIGSTLSIAQEVALYYDATNGRVSEPDLKALSEREARVLGRLLKPYVEQADEIRTQAEAGLRERNPELFSNEPGALEIPF